MDDRITTAIENLLHGDRRARDSAAFALEYMTFDVQLLVPVLEHPHASRQVKAIEALRRTRTREAVELVLPFLGSKIEIVQEKAIKTLGKIGRAAPEPIVAALETAGDATHRLNILDVLSYLQHPQGREVLLIQADAWEPAQRSRAIELLRRYRDEPAVETVLGGLADPDARKAAIDVAGRLRDPCFLPPLIEIWLEESARPSLETLYAIGKFGAEAIDLLLPRAAEPAIRTRVADAILRCMTNHEGAQRLWTLWERPEAAVRDACLQYFTRHADAHRGDRVRAALGAHVNDPDPMRRRWCVDAYQRLARVEGPDGEHAVDALRVLGADSDKSVADRAHAALRYMR